MLGDNHRLAPPPAGDDRGEIAEVEVIVHVNKVGIPYCDPQGPQAAYGPQRKWQSRPPLHCVPASGRCRHEPGDAIGFGIDIAGEPCNRPGPASGQPSCNLIRDDFNSAAMSGKIVGDQHHGACGRNAHVEVFGVLRCANDQWKWARKLTIANKPDTTRLATR